MAREWGEVPEYRASLASTLGEAGGAAFLDAVQRRADEMAVQAQTLFESWLRSAGVPVARARFAHRAPPDIDPDDGVHCSGARSVRR